MILQVSISYSSKYRLCTSNFTKTMSIWKWFNTLFRFMSGNMDYTPHAFNLTFLKKRLEFWTEIFRAIFLNMKAHMREVSSKSEMVTWRLFWKLGHLSRNDPIVTILFTYWTNKKLYNIHCIRNILWPVWKNFDVCPMVNSLSNLCLLWSNMKFKKYNFYAYI